MAMACGYDYFFPAMWFCVVLVSFWEDVSEGTESYGR